MSFQYLIISDVSSASAGTSITFGLHESIASELSYVASIYIQNLVSDFVLYTEGATTNQKYVFEIPLKFSDGGAIRCIFTNGTDEFYSSNIPIKKDKVVSSLGVTTDTKASGIKNNSKIREYEFFYSIIEQFLAIPLKNEIAKTSLKNREKNSVTIYDDDPGDIISAIIDTTGNNIIDDTITDVTFVFPSESEITKWGWEIDSDGVSMNINYTISQRISMNLDTKQYIFSFSIEENTLGTIYITDGQKNILDKIQIDSNKVIFDYTAYNPQFIYIWIIFDEPPADTSKPGVFSIESVTAIALDTPIEPDPQIENNSNLKFTVNKTTATRGENITFTVNDNSLVSPIRSLFICDDIVFDVQVIEFSNMPVNITCKIPSKIQIPSLSSCINAITTTDSNVHLLTSTAISIS